MTWITKDKTHNKITGTRIIKVFAFMPIKIGNESKWLETCYVRQRPYSVNHESGWKNVCFVDKATHKEYVATTNEDK